MSLSRRTAHTITLAGLLVLVTACSQASRMSTPGSTGTASTPLPGDTPTRAVGQASTPLPTSAPTADVSITEPTRQATPTAQTGKVVDTPSPESGTSVLPTSTSSPSPTRPPTPPPPAFPPSIALEPVLSGLEAPTYLTYAPGDPAGSSRLFIVEKAGRIRVAENGVMEAVPFLNITDRVGSGGSEQGLLSAAFPPEFADSRVFYVNYTDQRGDTVIARFALLEGNPRQADPGSEQKILQIEQPAANHNGGQLQFGPDGYLYIGTGDGGQAGDPWGNAQNLGVLLGKMLRIDVSGTEAYTVPEGNPFLGRPDARPEIWATGLRNPWRFAFDRVTGDLYIADVGQNIFEEIDLQPASSLGGENYGWDVMEGRHCFEPPAGCDPSGRVPPVAEYDHSQGCSVTGGYAYRGIRYPQLDGVYFFGDFCSGKIWGLAQGASGEWEMALLLDTQTNISSFGEDAEGEIYVAGYGDGTIYQLVALP